MESLSVLCRPRPLRQLFADFEENVSVKMEEEMRKKAVRCRQEHVDAAARDWQVTWRSVSGEMRSNGWKWSDESRVEGSKTEPL